MFRIHMRLHHGFLMILSAALVLGDPKSFQVMGLSTHMVITRSTDDQMEVRYYDVSINVETL